MPTTKTPPHERESDNRNFIDDIISDLPAEVPMAKVFGDFTDRIYIVNDTRMSLVLSPGRDADNDKPFLLPHVEVRMGKTHQSENESEPDFSALMTEILSLENAAFVVASLSNNMKVVSGELNRFREQTLKPDEARVRQARAFLASSVKETLAAIARLTTLIETYEKDEDRSELVERKTVRPRKRVLKRIEEAPAASKVRAKPKA